MAEIATRLWHWAQRDEKVVAIAPWHYYQDDCPGPYGMGIVSLPKTKAVYTQISAAIRDHGEAIKTDDVDLGPGLSIGTALKGCQKQCWLNATTQNLWPFDTEITVFEHGCQSTAGCRMNHLWTGGTWPGYQNRVSATTSTMRQSRQ